MKVVHISRFGDGSGPTIAASQLHKGLLQLGHESMMFVAQTRSAVKDPTVMLFQPPMDLRSRLRRRVRSERILRSLARYQASRPMATRLSVMTVPRMAPTYCPNSLLVM